MSYSYKDSFSARMVAQKLKSLGIEVWMDSDILAGENWKEAIFNAIEESDTFVILLTPESIENRNVFIEMGAAMASGKRIITVFAGMSAEQVLKQSQPLLSEFDLIPIEQFFDEAEDIVAAGHS